MDSKENHYKKAGAILKYNMTRLPRKKDDIMDALGNCPFAPRNVTEDLMPVIIELLIDIRDNLETPYITDNNN